MPAITDHDCLLRTEEGHAGKWKRAETHCLLPMPSTVDRPQQSAAIAGRQSYVLVDK